MRPRRFWTAEEVDLLEYCYEDTPTAELAAMLDFPVKRVYAKAKSLRLKKQRELIAEMARARALRPDHGSRRSRFQPGTVPANKGLRRPGYAPGRMAETQFKAGQRGNNWVPVDSVRVNSGGYKDRKIADTGYCGVDWALEHQMLWIEAHGDIPPGHALVFRDGDKANVVLENLELVTRAELMRRNTVHNLPKELVEVIMLNGALKRKLRKMTREKQNDRPAQSPVRNT